MIPNPFWNRDERRVRALWRLVLLFVCAFGTMILLFFLLRDPLGEQLGQRIALLLAVLLSTWIVGRFVDRRSFADFGFDLDRAWWLDFGFGFGLGVVLMGAIFLVEWALGWVTITGAWQSLEVGQTFLQGILISAVTFCCVGIYEEVLFRGYLVQNLAEGINFPRTGPRRALIVAWVLSSALFGMAHAFNPNASFISSLNISFAGVFIGLAYVLTRQLAVPIGLHISWNFFQGNVFGFPVSGGSGLPAQVMVIEQGGPEVWTGGSFGPEAGLLGLAAMITGTLLTLWWVRARYGPPHLALSIAEAPVREPDDAAAYPTAEV